MCQGVATTLVMKITVVEEIEVNITKPTLPAMPLLGTVAISALYKHSKADHLVSRSLVAAAVGCSLYYVHIDRHVTQAHNELLRSICVSNDHIDLFQR